LGTGATIIAGYIFPLNKEDKVSPPSVIGGAALFTNNGTRGMVIGTELYFKEDRYHVLAGMAHGDLNYDFYGTGTAAGNAGLKLGLNQKGTAFFGEAMRRIGWHIFVGPRIWIGSASLAPQQLGKSHPELPPLNVGFDLRALGFKIERDTTPNRFYPVSGSMLHFGADFFAKGIGSTFSFQTYRLTFNEYHSFGAKQVLAYNIFVCTTGGQAPFFGKCIFGMQNELRGYPAGRYIDRQMFATQAEYRRSLFWRVGAVAFGGVGEVAPSLSKFNASNLLPSVGGGLRFNLSTKYHVNLRADLAQGKDGHTFSMGIGEAF
jgi:outer membrane protein assembly factor BamA